MEWFQVHDESAIPSPSLFLHLERVERNLRRMLTIAGGPSRLWTHVKTHKLGPLVRMQVDLGISSFKCATVAEAEMLAGVEGVQGILVALQPVGPQQARILDLAKAHPGIRFSVILDNASTAQALARSAKEAGFGTPALPPLGAFIDLDVGQGRTGIAADASAEALALLIAESGSLGLVGLHAYDGHLGISDPAERTLACDRAFEPVAALRSRLESSLARPIEVIAGGSPTFGIHARRKRVSLSPGTTVFWDAGYAAKLPDLPFEPAVVLLTRVVSKPASNRLCLDLGHKAVASEMPQPRVLFLDLNPVTFVSHSEEHLVVESPAAENLSVGDTLHALPWHVCPTVALHSEILVVRDSVASTSWSVTARARRLRF